MPNGEQGSQDHHKRRGHGEGSIFQRTDGRWAGVLTCGRDVTGNRRRRYVYGDTRAEVQQALARLLHDQFQGLPVDPVKQSVGGFLASWLEDVVRVSARPKTYRSYEGVIRLHLVPALGKIRLPKLGPQHLQRFYREKQDTGLTRTVRLCHAVLHRALGQATKWGLVPRNVADLVDAPRVAHREMCALSPEEAGRLLEAAREDRLHALYVLAVTVGMRQGELLGLKGEDFDFDAGSLQVRRQLQWVKREDRGEGRHMRTGPAWVLTEPKSAKSRRTVTLPGLAVAALKRHKVQQAQERLALGEAWQDLGFVFTTPVGTPVDPSGLRKRSFVPLLERARVPEVRFHDLRHTAATLLLAQGVHPKLVQEQLGHSQISLTLDTYSHVLPALQREAASKMDALFTGVGR